MGVPLLVVKILKMAFDNVNQAACARARGARRYQVGPLPQDIDDILLGARGQVRCLFWHGGAMKVHLTRLIRQDDHKVAKPAAGLSSLAEIGQKMVG